MLANENKPWFEVYKAAMLELDLKRLPGRIVAAKEAVALRIIEIQGDTDHHAERHEIQDALSNLRTLEREKGLSNVPSRRPNMWGQRKMLAPLHQELETIALFDRVHEMTTNRDSAGDRAYAARQIRRWQIVVEIQKLSGKILFPRPGRRTRKP